MPNKLKILVPGARAAVAGYAPRRSYNHPGMLYAMSPIEKGGVTVRLRCPRCGLEIRYKDHPACYIFISDDRRSTMSYTRWLNNRNKGKASCPSCYGRVLRSKVESFCMMDSPAARQRFFDEYVSTPA